MGLRFRRSINLGGGVRLNVGKKSTGISFGTRGARVSFNSKGRATTSVGIPGTGLYYQKSTNLAKKSRGGNSQAFQTLDNQPAKLKTTGEFIFAGCCVAIPGLFLFLVPLGITQILGAACIAWGGYMIVTSKKKSSKIKADEEQKQNALKAAREEHIAQKQKEFSEILEKIPKCEVALDASDTQLAKLSPSDISSLTYSRLTVKTNRSKISSFVVIDVETTGLSAYNDEIIEISAIRFYDFKPVELFSTLINPGKSIPKKATSVNGITDDMVLNSPTFSQIASALSAFIGKSNIVGHNLPFDLGFIYRAGLDFTKPAHKYYDTLELSKSITDSDSYKLGDLCEDYNIFIDNAHRASADCLATGMLFEKLVEEKLGVAEL